MQLIVMKMKMKNWSLRYDINRPRYRHENKYTKYKMCLSMMMLICIKQQPKQHLKFNSWKSKATLRLSWKKSAAYKKSVYYKKEYFSSILCTKVKF